MPTDEHLLRDRIVVSRDICHGKPRIAGTRIMVYQLLDLLAANLSIETIIGEDYFPDLSREDVLACVAYASQVVQAETVIPIL